MYTNAYFMNQYFYNTVERPMLKRRALVLQERIKELEESTDKFIEKRKNLEKELEEVKAKL